MMNRLFDLLHSYHPTVWFLIVGTALTRISQSMTLPFLALYLLKDPAMTPVYIGLVIGAASFTGIFAGFIGGNLSDRYGRKKLMVFSMFLWVMVFLGFGLAKAVWMFFLLSALNGMSRAFFEPTSQAMMADLTSPEKRQRVFAMRYMAINFGAALGPLLGTYLGISSTKTTFFITGIVYLLYGIGIVVFLTESWQGAPISSHRVTMKEALMVLARDGALAFFLLAGILINLGYSQIESTLPQYMQQVFGAGGPKFYSWVVTLNAATVVFLQVPITQVSLRYTPLRQMMYGALLFSAGYICFGSLHSLTGMMTAMVVLTIGEILVMPAGMVFLDQIAPEHLRGSYFGAGSLRNLGFSIGPGFGGWLMMILGPSAMFYTFAVMVLSTVFLYIFGNSLYLKRQKEDSLNFS
jgi:MFS family permease